MPYKEMYIQRSVQDYFIKFCESNISRTEFESHLATLTSEIKVVRLQIEYRDGNWDICNENEMLQSRMGAYIIIHKIL